MTFWGEKSQSDSGKSAVSIFVFKDYFVRRKAILTPDLSLGISTFLMSVPNIVLFLFIHTKTDKDSTINKHIVW